jgi:hypothetical protein
VPSKLVYSTSPSTEWQERVIERLSSLSSSRGQALPSSSHTSPHPSFDAGRPALSLNIGTPEHDSSGPRRSRQRRTSSHSPSDSFHSLRSSPIGAGASSSAILGCDAMDEHEKNRNAEEDALVSEVGQLSLNEEREVRFHGQASGLHLLDLKERVDGRNEGGIWRVTPSFRMERLFTHSAESGIFQKPVSGHLYRGLSIQLSSAARKCPSLYQTVRRKRDCWRSTLLMFILHCPFSTNRVSWRN